MVRVASPASVMHPRSWRAPRPQALAADAQQTGAHAHGDVEVTFIRHNGALLASSLTLVQQGGYLAESEEPGLIGAITQAGGGEAHPLGEGQDYRGAAPGGAAWRGGGR